MTVKQAKKKKKIVAIKKKLPKKKMRFINRKLTKGLGEAVAKRTYLRTD
jgi:UTP-glucose-1-phosphate uridylyltransferase